MLQTLSLELDPKQLRRTVLKMAKNGNSVHIACAFSLVEIVSVLYGKFARLDINDPLHPDRDIVALSKGHGVMALYACFLEMRWIGSNDIDNYFSDGSRLKGLGDCHLPGVDVTGGSLGHGLTVAVGMALAAKLSGSDKRIYCIVGDGEMNEGSMWESLLFASHWKLDNLIVIVDANGFQAMGRSAEVLNCEPFISKFSAFNFEAWECDGHDREALSQCLEAAIRSSACQKPKAIVGRTTKGKGISFMEDDNIWHYTRLDNEKFDLALGELR